MAPRRLSIHSMLVLGPIIVSGLGRVASFEVCSKQFSTNSCQNSFNSLFLIDNLNLKLYTFWYLISYITTYFIPDAQPPLQYPNIGLNMLLLNSEIALGKASKKQNG